MDSIGGYAFSFIGQGIWAMSSDISISPEIWVWYLQFFISMGGVLSAASSLAIGVLLTHWLYLCARKIESKTTPTSFPKAIFRLSGFQALIAGVALVPFSTIALFYLLSDLVWKFAPTPTAPSTPPADIPLPNFDPASSDEWFAGMASLIIYLAALTVIIGGTIFFLLRRYAKRIDGKEASIGFLKKVVRRYFYENILVGVVLILIACPVILAFFYNIAWLVILCVPWAVQGLSAIALPDAEKAYFRSLEVIGSWLIIVLFIPAFWLLAKGQRLRLRYTIENPTMNLIFKRSVKIFTLGLFGYVGCTAMHYLADSSFGVVIQRIFKWLPLGP